MNIRKIDTHVYCGPRPKTKEDLDKILTLGVNHFVSLQTGAYEAIHDDPYENAFISSWNFKCSDVTPPSKSKTMEIVRWLHLLQTKSDSVYFHCLHGRDRTGWVLAAYRIIAQGWTEERALKEYLGHGLHWAYRFWWPHIFKKRGFRK